VNANIAGLSPVDDAAGRLHRSAPIGILQADVTVGRNRLMGIVRHDDAASAVRAARSSGKRIVTFVGFSAGGYEDPEAVERAMRECLARFDPARAVVCAGATPDGVGAVYPLAHALGFETLGIVSSVAEKEGVAFSPHVDVVHVVKDDAWGGMHGGRLSPTSTAMVQASDEIIAIGGGEIARAEAKAAREAGVVVTELPGRRSGGRT
jgi:hypothetical protein